MRQDLQRIALANYAATAETRMIDPTDPACAPAACLRAEAEDLRAHAEHLRDEADKAEASAPELRTEAETHDTLATRYEAAASLLDQHEDKTAAPFLADT